MFGIVARKRQLPQLTLSSRNGLFTHLMMSLWAADHARFVCSIYRRVRRHRLRKRETPRRSWRERMAGPFMLSGTRCQRSPTSSGTCAAFRRIALGSVLRTSPRSRSGHAVDLCQLPSASSRYVPFSYRNRCAVDIRGTTLVMQARRYKTYAIDSVGPRRLRQWLAAGAAGTEEPSR